MSLGNNFIAYYNEEHGQSVLHDEKGFITYRHFPKSKEIMIGEFFVVPKFRRSPAAFRLAERVREIGVEKGCTHMTCRVGFDPINMEHMRRKSKALTAYLRYGFNIFDVSDNEIYLVKEIEGQHG